MNESFPESYSELGGDAVVPDDANDRTYVSEFESEQGLNAEIAESLAEIDTKMNDPKAQLIDLYAAVERAESFCEQGYISKSQYEQYRIQLESHVTTQMLIYRIESAEHTINIGVILESARQSLESGLITAEQRDEVQKYADSKLYALGIKKHYDLESSKPEKSDWRKNQLPRGDR
jgi:hypothetical protein